MTDASGNANARSNSGRYAVRHDWNSDEQVTVSVAEALADYAGVPVCELPPSTTP